MAAEYVISVKQVKDHYNKPIAYDRQFWVYAMNDDKGPMASGYPVFASFERDAIKFRSIREATEWWEKNKRYICSDMSKYDMETLSIRRHINIYKTAVKLTVNNEID